MYANTLRYVFASTIGAQDPVSSYFDQTFDGAHNLTLKAGDLKNVRWARVDYLEVTDITTRWGIWKSVLPPCSLRIYIYISNHIILC